MEKKTNALSKTTLSAQTIRVFFITHLNIVYCAKSHVQERLPEMRIHAHFTDLKHAIRETLDDVEKQIKRMDKIYDLLGIDHNFEECQGIIGLIEDTFTAIYRESNDHEIRDLSILFYLQNIESVEMASFKMLKLAAPVMGDKEIEQLLTENFDEACDDLGLLHLITECYFGIK